MGPCQGGICAFRSSGLLYDLLKNGNKDINSLMSEFLEERWKGIQPVLWGDSLREFEYNYWIYQGLFNLGNPKLQYEVEN